MTKTFFFSDPHLGHDKACKEFIRPDGSPLRDFQDAEEADAYYKAKHNELVSAEDRVYCLGDLDVSRNYRNLHKFAELNGRKVIVPGNHDMNIDKLRAYGEVRSYIVKKAFIGSHIPLHMDCVNRFNLNIHGHLHYNVINDPRYISVCVEQIQFQPITLDEILERVEANKKSFTETGKVINWADTGTRR